MNTSIKNYIHFAVKTYINMNINTKYTFKNNYLF